MTDLPTWPFIIIAPLLGILGAFAVRRYITFQNASIKFREAILNELGDIYPNPINWKENTLDIVPLLKSKFVALQTAVEEFRMALPWYKRKAFDKAWLRYHCPPAYRADKDYQGYAHYVPCVSTSIINKKQVTVETTKET